MLQRQSNFTDANIYYMQKGKEFQNQGNFEEAILCYQQVINLDPHSFWGHHLLGCALEKQNQQHEAIAAWLKAISFNLNNDARYWTHYSLSWSLKKQGDIGSAIYHCQQAILIKPDQTDFYNLLAQLYVSLNELEPEAIYKAIVNSLQNSKEYHQYIASDRQTQFIQDSSVSTYSYVQSTVFSSPLEITLLGTSSSLQSEGYCKYLIERLNALVTDRSEHNLNKLCLGATSSILGCFYSIRNYIANSSNLVLVDFCINDRNEFYGKILSKQTIAKSIEGCIRHIKSINLNCIIIIINLSSCHEKHIERIENNECEISILYNLIADYYKIPVIDVTRKLIDTKGKLYFKSLYSEDDIYHPSQPLGSKIIGDTIYDELCQLDLTINHKCLPKPLYSDNYSDLQILESAFLESFIRGSYFQDEFKTSLLQENYFSLNQEASIEFLLKGNLNGLYYVASPDSGYLVIEMGDKIVTVSLYSMWNEKIPKSLCLFGNLAEFQLVSHDFVNVKISLLNSNAEPQNYRDLSSAKPPLEAAAWKFNVISLTYQGEVRALN